ncbi:MAG: hypothetical protein ACYCW6_04215 [Candidatus Xenobia bacterium]
MMETMQPPVVVLDSRHGMGAAVADALERRPDTPPVRLIDLEGSTLAQAVEKVAALKPGAVVVHAQLPLQDAAPSRWAGLELVSRLRQAGPGGAVLLTFDAAETLATRHPAAPLLLSRPAATAIVRVPPLSVPALADAVRRVWDAPHDRSLARQLEASERVERNTASALLQRLEGACQTLREPPLDIVQRVAARLPETPWAAALQPLLTTLTERLRALPCPLEDLEAALRQAIAGVPREERLALRLEHDLLGNVLAVVQLEMRALAETDLSPLRRLAPGSSLPAPSSEAAVLVVEDDPNWRRRIAALAARVLPQARVAAASNAAEARQIMADLKPRLMVLDLQLSPDEGPPEAPPAAPGGSVADVPEGEVEQPPGVARRSGLPEGLSLLEEARGTDVVVVSAYTADPEIVSACARQGAAAFVFKDGDADQRLMAALRRMWEKGPDRIGRLQVLSFTGRVAVVDGRQMELDRALFAVLEALVEAGLRGASVRELARSVGEGKRPEHAAKARISELRKQLPVVETLGSGEALRYRLLPHIQASIHHVAPDTAVRPLRVLVVEDSPAISRMLCANLQSLSPLVEVTAAATVEAARGVEADVLCLDLELPWREHEAPQAEHGIQVLLEARQRNPEVAALVFTGHDHTRWRARLWSEGVRAFDFVGKGDNLEGGLRRVLSIVYRFAMEWQRGVRLGDDVLPVRLRLDAAASRLGIDDFSVALTPLELRLLQWATRHPGLPLSEVTWLEVEPDDARAAEVRRRTLPLRRSAARVRAAGKTLGTIAPMEWLALTETVGGGPLGERIRAAAARGETVTIGDLELSPRDAELLPALPDAGDPREVWYRLCSRTTGRGGTQEARVVLAARQAGKDDEYCAMLRKVFEHHARGYRLNAIILPA